MSSPISEYRSIQLGPERDHLNDIPVNLNDIPESGSLPERPATGIERHTVEERALDNQADNWRDEVSSRLSNYAKRRGRQRLAGQYSMELDFERPRRSNTATAPALEPIFDEPQPETAARVSELSVEAPDPILDTPVQQEWSPALDSPDVSRIFEAEEAIPAPEPMPAPPRRKHHRIIQFPRLFSIEQVETTPDELAETLDAPRILDVPEETEQIILPLADISLEMQQQVEEPAASPELDPPIQVAGVSQRAFAAIADGIIVLFATAVFAGIALNLASSLPHTKFTLMMGLLVPGIFWSVYQYLFVVHAAGTPGMKLAQLRIASFDRRATTRHSRRIRALALILSFASAGMGFGWALVDEDTLCWHDRISRTYLTQIQ